MNVKELLKKCQRDRTAVLATNFYNFETLTAVMQAAQRMQAPVLLQLTRSSKMTGKEKEFARRAIADYGVEGWIHLDHGGSVELVERCLDAGFDSVMIDASERPFDENVSTTRRVVELARSYGVNVEAELGYVAKLGQAQGGGFTTPEEAARFVEATGVDALAVAIGSAHGFYKQAPRLDIERLAQIHAATDAALVLHGSSGIPHDMVREAIANGIVKVNLATEIKDNFMPKSRGAGRGAALRKIPHGRQQQGEIGEHNRATDRLRKAILDNPPNHPASDRQKRDDSYPRTFVLRASQYLHPVVQRYPDEIYYGYPCIPTKKRCAVNRHTALNTTSMDQLAAKPEKSVWKAAAS